MKHITTIALAFLICLIMAGTIHAVLIDNQNGTIDIRNNGGSKIQGFFEH